MRQTVGIAIVVTVIKAFILLLVFMNNPPPIEALPKDNRAMQTNEWGFRP